MLLILFNHSNFSRYPVALWLQLTFFIAFFVWALLGLIYRNKPKQFVTSAMFGLTIIGVGVSVVCLALLVEAGWNVGNTIDVLYMGRFSTGIHSTAETVPGTIISLLLVTFLIIIVLAGGMNKRFRKLLLKNVSLKQK